jgi:hypothetical protein
MATRTTNGWPLVLIGLFLLAAVGTKSFLIQPPSLPATITEGQFDHRRAVARLDRILGDQRPHPVDTPANDAVRERLIIELTAIGLNSQVQEATDCSDFPKSRAVSCSHVRNVIATLPGNPNKPALLLNAHYDSTPAGPGAADDGIGVATMLEVAALMKDAPRDRSIIFLFNEGEEFGLNGAAAFAQHNRLASGIGKLINMESRGVTGPVVLAETSNPNGKDIAGYAAVTRTPYANSLTADFAKLIPNSTDVVKFKPKEWQTLSYAIIGNETRYHTPGDDLAHLDRRSVQQMGDHVLAATRRFAGPDIPASGAQKVYTDVAGKVLFTLPLVGAAVALGVLVLVALTLVHRRKAWRALGWTALIFTISVAAAVAMTILVGLIRPGDYWRAFPFVPTLAVATTVIAAQAWLLPLILHRHDAAQRRLAAWALVLTIGGLLSVFMSGAVIFFLLGPALGLAGVWWRPASWLGALVQLLMFTELVALIEMVLIDGPAWATAPLIALAALPLLTEAARITRMPAILFTGLALGLWLVALIMPRASADRPAAFNIDHVQDERLGTAYWALATKQAPLPDTFDKFGPWKAAPLPYNKRLRWQAQAPLMEGARGQVVLTRDRRDGETRTIRLRLNRAGGDAIVLRFDEETPILAMGLPDALRTIDPTADKGPSLIRCTGRRCDGLEVEVTFGTAKPVTAMLITSRFALPPEAEPLVRARPDDAHPQYGPDSQIRVRAIRI